MTARIIDWLVGAGICLGVAGVLACLAFSVMLSDEDWDDDAGKGE